MNIGNGPFGTIVMPSGCNGMDIGNGPFGARGLCLRGLMEWKLVMGLLARGLCLRALKELKVMGLWARWLCLREFNGMNIGNGPFGTMVMPLGFKEMNSGKGPLGTMVMPSGFQWNGHW